MTGCLFSNRPEVRGSLDGGVIACFFPAPAPGPTIFQQFRVGKHQNTLSEEGTHENKALRFE